MANRDDDARRRDDYTALYRRFLPAVRAHARMWVRPDEVEEIVSATFLTTWAKFDTIEAGAEKAWLLATARNHIRNLYRSRRRGYSSTEWIASTEDPADLAVESEADPQEYALVMRAFASLSDAERELLALSIWQELTPAEIAAVVGISQGAARVRLFRARRRFEDAVRRERDGGELP